MDVDVPAQPSVPLETVILPGCKKHTDTFKKSLFKGVCG